MSEEVRAFNIQSIERTPADPPKQKYPKVTVEILKSDGSVVRGYANDGKWNADWKVGGKGRAVMVEKTSANGNSYYNLKCPEDMKPKMGSGGFGGGKAEKTLEEIHQELVKIRIALTSETDQGDSPDPVDEPSEPEQHEPEQETPEKPGDDEINVDDIPF